MKKKKKKKISENFHSLVIKFSVYLNRRVFKMSCFMNNAWLDTFTSFPFAVRGRTLVMDHCSLYSLSHGFGLFTNLLLSYLFRIYFSLLRC